MYTQKVKATLKDGTVIVRQYKRNQISVVLNEEDALLAEQLAQDMGLDSATAYVRMIVRQHIKEKSKSLK